MVGEKNELIFDWREVFGETFKGLNFSVRGFFDGGDRTGDGYFISILSASEKGNFYVIRYMI